MKKLDFDLNENLFKDFLSARYSISARVNVEKLWKWCKKNDKSFFIMSLGCLMNATNSVDALKRRIIDGEAIEYDYVEGVSPIMDKDSETYKEMRVKVPQKFRNMIEWHDYVKTLSEDILTGRKEGFTLEMEKRDFTNIVNFSCIPWIDFDMMTTCVVDGMAIQPLITWGRVNENYEMSVAITVSHIFVNGRELGFFYENLQKELDEF